MAKEIEINVRGGKIVAQTFEDAERPAINVFFRKDGLPAGVNEVDACVIAYEPGEDAIKLFVYDDVNQENYTRVYSLDIEKVLHLVNEMDA
jgi:hypothetical protein